MAEYKENAWYWASNPNEGDLFIPMQFINGVFLHRNEIYRLDQVVGMNLVEAVMPDARKEIGLKLKLAEDPKCGDVVDYFGIKMSVSRKYNYIATDGDGEIWLYVNKPEGASDMVPPSWFSDCDYERVHILVDMEGVDWAKTLMKIERGD